MSALARFPLLPRGSATRFLLLLVQLYQEHTDRPAEWPIQADERRISVPERQQSGMNQREGNHGVLQYNMRPGESARRLTGQADQPFSVFEQMPGVVKKR
jgi:hypothetical protein